MARDTWKLQYCKPNPEEDILLVGGEFDHRVITADASKTYVQMQIMDTNDRENKSERYRIETLRGAYKFYKLGIHESLSVDDAVKALIDFYKDE